MPEETKNQECSHQFAIIEGKTGPNGEWLLSCSKCGLLKYQNPPTPLKESRDDKKLLME